MILDFIFIFSFLIIFTAVASIHELGHFLAAKLSGMKVFEFSLGFGPKIFQKKFNGTTLSIRPIPLGGFVRIAGIDHEEEKEAGSYKEEQSFKNKPFFSKFITILSGPAANIVAAFLIFSILFFASGIPRISNEIESVVPGSPAEKFGIKAGDRLLAVSNVTTLDEEGIRKGVELINKSAGRKLAIKVGRAGKTLLFRVAPEYNPKLKLARLGVGFKVNYERKDFFVSFFEGLKSIFVLIMSIFVTLVALVLGKIPLTESVMGPIGIAQISMEAAKAGIYHFVWLLAMISGFLGVFNLFPIPPLDGGRILFLLIEALARRPLGEKIEKAVILAGWLVLFVLFAIATRNDIIRIITKQQ